MSPDAVLVVAFWALFAVWPLVYVCYPVALLTIARWRGIRPMEVDLPWSFDTRAEFDLRYIDTWSMRQDLKVLARTVPVALGASGR